MLMVVEQLSVAVGRPGFAGPNEVLHSTTSSVGHVRTGAISGFTLGALRGDPDVPRSPHPPWATATAVTFVRVEPEHSRTRCAGSVKAGGVVSRTVMVCTQLALLPQESVAVKRREITRLPPQALVTVSLKLTTTEPQ